MTDLPEPILDEELDYTTEDYAQPDAPYIDVLDEKDLKRVQMWKECVELVRRGVTKTIDGDYDQLEGLFNIWKYQLWRYSDQGYKSQRVWEDEFFSHERVSVIADRNLNKTSFNNMMQAIAKGLSAGLEFKDALALGPKYLALEEAENSGAIVFTQARSGHKKKPDYVMSVTPIGEEKLLKGGLISPTQYLTSLSTMTPKDATKTVRHDVGRKYAYCSLIQEYAGGTPFIDESECRIFALEFRDVDPETGETPYAGKLVIPKDMPKKSVVEVLKKLWWKFDGGVDET